MSWFVFTLVCVLGWGLADLFYKKGSTEEDPRSHLKIAVWVGLVMGVCAFALLPLSESRMGAAELVTNAVRYAPASLSYIVSMVIGYAGLRYLELSIVSPVQNASGALSALVMTVWFTVSGRFTDLREEFGPLDLGGTFLIVLGVILLAVTEQRLAATPEAPAGTPAAAEDRRYRTGALALLFPLLYCLFDTLGTAADGIILDEQTGLGLGELDVIVLYGLTFFLAGLGAWIFLWIRGKKPYNPFARTELPKAGAALCEEFGQVFYVFAMARNPVLAAPAVASYCIVSVLLSRLILKEKLTKGQTVCVLLVICGIVLLGVSEGLAEG